MKIYHDCPVIVGTVLRNMIIGWINKMGKQVVIQGPPLGEWYAEEATPHKPIDKQITDHIKRVIQGGG